MIRRALEPVADAPPIQTGRGITFRVLKHVEPTSAEPRLALLAGFCPRRRVTKAVHTVRRVSPKPRGPEVPTRTLTNGFAAAQRMLANSWMRLMGSIMLVNVLGWIACWLIRPNRRSTWLWGG